MNAEEKQIYYNNLFDIYGNLLNEREKEIFALFYEEDLSLQEIADHRSVSKSSVGSAIQTINKKLEIYEEKLKIFAKNTTLKEEIKKIADQSLQEKLCSIIDNF